MTPSAEPVSGAPSRWRFLWLPIVWLWRISIACAVVSLRICWWMLIPLRRLMAPLKEWSWWKRNVSSLRLRSVPLRRWLVLSLGLLLFLPLITASMTALVVHVVDGTTGPGVDEVLGQEADRWTDPVWQAEVTAELHQRDMEFLLLVDGQEVYRSTAEPLDREEFEGEIRHFNFDSGGVERIAIVYGDEWVPFGDEDDAWPVPVVAFGTLVLTFIGIGIFFGRTVVKPLAATSSAAADIAGGKLDVALPSSRVREVSDLNAAFQGMATALSESLAHEAQLEQERRLFIGAVAHDLRTPLFSLRGSLEAIRTGVADTEEKQERYLNTAQEKADALDRLITDLFDFTRLEYLEMEPKRESLEFGTLVQRSCEAMAPQAARKGVELHVEDHSAGARVLGDPHLLTRAIDNLVDNAIRFTPAGGEAAVEVLRDSDALVMSVSDTGPGIPDHDLPNIFQPLYRGESSRNRRTGGAGLGLTIARNVFVAHGGSLDARNLPAGGARFVASIPFSAAS